MKSLQRCFVCGVGSGARAGASWRRRVTTTKTIELTGTVKEFQFTNPHSWIQVDVKDQTGKIVEWSLEWGSPNTLTRQGIHPSTFPVGAKGTFKVHPVKTGAPIGSFVGVKFEDGTTVGKWDAPDASE